MCLFCLSVPRRLPWSHPPSPEIHDVLRSIAALMTLPAFLMSSWVQGFRSFAETYAADQAQFFADYVAAHLKLSEQGVKWEEGSPITLPEI